MSERWIVLKYGGTSVSGAGCWDRIADRVRDLAPTRRVWITASAVSGISDLLERAVEQALAGDPGDALERIERRHRELADELGLDAADRKPVAELLEELRLLLEGIRLTHEAPPRLRARVMAFGELASTRLGVAALRDRGVEACWTDARTLLESSPRPGEPEGLRFLEAVVRPAGDPARAEAAVGPARVVLTQGFLARTPKGETCLLGRGGSDTSAALFAALLGAERLEIWTDVHGMFTADPRRIPSARLIRRIGYREAQELAAMGAKVLHPGCLSPAAGAGIPVEVRNSFDPAAEGTCIAADRDAEPAVMAVVCRTGTTLVSLATLDMWGASGFLARAFAPFEQAGISVDLVATSQSAVSVTLDRVPGGLDGAHFAELLARLRELGEVRVVHPCAVVSIVGRRIRTVLHELGPAMAVFREHEVHLVSESSEDLNLSFVVDEGDAAPLVRDLHHRLFPPHRAATASPRFGETWEMLQGRRDRAARDGAAAPEATERRAARPAEAWWSRRRAELLALCADGSARYVYDPSVVRERARELRRRVGTVGQWFYAIKANPHPALIGAVVAEGFGLECVSLGEVRRAREVAAGGVPVLFTPNFCPVAEYAEARELGAEVTVDGPEVLEQAPELFRGTEIALRIDPGGGLGHHAKVRTAGADAKFGHPADEVEALAEVAARLGLRVVGLHAHIGSGILDPAAWARTAGRLAELRGRFPDLRWIDPGGGLGVVERPGQQPLDLDAVAEALAAIAGGLGGGVLLRLEPGRYLVSEAGVLLAPVTQVRSKGGVRLVGVATGMNSLVRPAMYGAWHAIHNLTRLDEGPGGYAHVVGPICESSDVLGRDRLLPATGPGDVLLVENAGAYGAAMASWYNLREPAAEVVLGESGRGAEY